MKIKVIPTVNVPPNSGALYYAGGCGIQMIVQVRPFIYQIISLSTGNRYVDDVFTVKALIKYINRKGFTRLPSGTKLEFTAE